MMRFQASHGVALDGDVGDNGTALNKQPYESKPTDSCESLLFSPSDICARKSHRRVVIASSYRTKVMDSHPKVRNRIS